MLSACFRLWYRGWWGFWLCLGLEGIHELLCVFTIFINPRGIARLLLSPAVDISRHRKLGSRPFFCPRVGFSLPHHRDSAYFQPTAQVKTLHRGTLQVVVSTPSSGIATWR